MKYTCLSHDKVDEPLRCNRPFGSTAAEVRPQVVTSPTLTVEPLPENELTPLRETIRTLYSQIEAHVEAALLKAIRLGGKLYEAQTTLKHNRCYEDWVEINLPFSVRSARDYVTLFLNRERFESGGSEERLSIRSALKLVRGDSKTVSPQTHEVCPPAINVQDEQGAQEEIRLAGREVLLVEADEGFISQLFALVRAAKKTGKEVEFQRIGTFDSEVRLNAPFKDLLLAGKSSRPRLIPNGSSGL